MPKIVTVTVQCSLKGLQKERAGGYSHRGGCVDVPTQGGDGWTHPAIVPLLPLTPPNLIEALSMFEPLSYCPGYLVASTNAIIPTFQVPLSPLTFFIRYSKLRMLFQKKKIQNVLTYTKGSCSLQAKNQSQTLASTVYPNLYQQALPSFPVPVFPSNPGYFVGICPISL